MLEVSKFGPIGLVVVQSTSLCNLDCSYCYLPDRQRRKVFDLKLLPLLMRRIFESPYCGSSFSLVWHAGEPLTLPISYYDQASDIIREKTSELTGGVVEVEQHVQTNATLINDEWCGCFQRNNIVVGISVDGPKQVHDTHRRFRRGIGSHDLVMKGIDSLHRHEIPFHAIVVLTAEAMKSPDEMYTFFRDHGIHAVGFNVEEQEGVNAQTSMQGRAREEQYKHFLRRFWDLNEADGFPISLREFEEPLDLIRSGQRLSMNELTRPFSILSVDWMGNFSTFDPELLSVATERYGIFNLGNIVDTSLADATAGGQFKRIFADMAAGISECRDTCDYFGLCGGGMGSNKFWERGTLNCSETHACRFNTKIPVQVLLERFECGPPPAALVEG
jgi:uncharacterized protein